MKWRLILTVLVGVVLLGHAVHFGMHPSTNTHAFGMLMLNRKGLNI